MRQGRTWHLHRGFSLVELMTASAIGLFLISGVVYLLSETTQSVRFALQSMHLRQTHATLLSIMTGELRRAGSWEQAGLVSDAIPNGFAPIHRVGDDCLLYSYDQERDDTDGIPDPEDQHGLRLSSGVLQIKTSDDFCSAGVCTNCDTGYWLALTDPRTVTITDLKFDEAVESLPFNDGLNTVVLRTIGIEVSGRMRHAPAIRHRQYAMVNLVNDEIR